MSKKKELDRSDKFVWDEGDVKITFPLKKKKKQPKKAGD